MKRAKRALAKRAYPVPGPEGGKLIRQVIAGFREARISLPVTSDILIAVSGGADSTALAHLLLTYGRRVVTPERIVLLHINHGWRGRASDGDEAFVTALGRHFGVRTICRKFPKGAKIEGSLEEAARVLRQKLFAEESEAKRGALILTAHHADDVAETVLWRLLTGAAATHGGGILPRHGHQIRPLLKVRKDSLKRYLKEEGQHWREDATNFEGKLLRSKLRLELMPVLERLFPRGVEHLVTIAFRALQSSGEAPADLPGQALSEAFGSLGIRPRRSHWEAIARNPGELHLPEGWRLRREEEGRWIIERGVRPHESKKTTASTGRASKSTAQERADSLINIENDNGT